MNEPTPIQKKLWKAQQKVANKFPVGEFKIYSATQFQITPIQDIYLKGTSKVYLKEKKASSNPFGGLTEYIVYMNHIISPNHTLTEGDYLWDRDNNKIICITAVGDYDDTTCIELPNSISISRVVYSDTSTGTEAQKQSIVETLPCVVEFGAFSMGGMIPASSPAQAGYDQIKITTAIDPSLIALGDIITHNEVDMTILSIAYTPLTKGAIIIAKVMG